MTKYLLRRLLVSIPVLIGITMATYLIMNLAPGDPVGGVWVVVGPEGGIDPAELDALSGAGARILRLGETVLRTSSAGPAALAVLNVALGRW